jgi:SNF2 family DNA or RNA helicase
VTSTEEGIPLWAFQKEDLIKAAEVRVFLNGNDMGAGKTRWAVALDQVRRTQSRRTKTLVICNQTAFESPWKTTFEEFTNLRVMNLDTENAWARNKSWKEWKKGNHDVLIIHWHGLLLLPLKDEEWLHIIGDEIHKICSRKNKWTRALKQIKTDFKTGLSGTLSKGPADSFWSPLNWILPREFSDFWKYRSNYSELEEVWVKGEDGKAKKAGYTKVAGPKNEKQLRAIIQPYYCRHMKKERCCPHHPLGVRPDMPDKLYDELYVTQPKIVMDAYEGMRLNRIAWVEDQMKNNVPITAANAAVKMMRLIQFAISYCAVDPETGLVTMVEPSAKLDAMQEKLSESEDQIVVWTNFKAVVRMAEARLDKARIPYSELTGKVKGKDRTREIQKFIRGDSRILIGTIATGAESIDGLQHVCDTAIYLDRSWSVLANQQSEDRLWREGQKNSVHIIDIMAHGTVDAGRQQKLEMQWEWIHRLLTGPRA